MTATADMILERRKVRRKLALWRIAAIVAIIVAVIAILPRFGGVKPPHIAQIAVEGVIYHEPDREQAILNIAKDDSVKALIVAIDSPGGTLVGSEALYDALRKVAAEKPVVAVMAEVAASGGYVTAIGTDHIIARKTTMTGSVGVILQAPNFSGLLDMVGVEVREIKSAPLKAAPSLVQPVQPEAIQAQEILIGQAYDWFQGLVAERRNLDGTKLSEVTDGRVFLGQKALEHGLIDAIGDIETAKTWLAEEKDIDTDLPVLTWTWGNDDLGWPWADLQTATAGLSKPSRLIDAAPRLYAIMR